MNASNTYDNNSFTFYGPIEMAFDEDSEDNALEGTEIKLAFSIALSIIAVISFIGNTSTCVVILRERSMRTPTNYYLLNLAIADLLLSFFIPAELYIMWMPDDYPLGEIGCRMHVLLGNLLSCAGVLTISVFTIERYLVVSRPFLRQTLADTSRVWKIVLLIWFFCLCFIMPTVLSSDILVRKKQVYCYMTLSNVLRIFMTMQLLIFLLGPMVLIATLYTLIAIKLKSTKMRRSPVNGKQNRDKAVKMLAAVTGTFFFCWFPYFMINIMTVVPRFHYEDYYDTWRVMNYFSLLNGYLSTTVNPILYGLMSRRFRRAFKEVFRGLCSSKPIRSYSSKTTNVVTLTQEAF